eukprot:TRINITY_DN8514_c0_g1_i1.p1 TRINITY_DN8514_c0_g1~~TRINITY_DN8514_c0_g1_i1.p1  ORF type:complete len:686 (-),score=192.08 TRINITY_DN8514_c0_g1_i1:314-2068(-)
MINISTNSSVNIPPRESSEFVDFQPIPLRQRPGSSERDAVEIHSDNSENGGSVSNTDGNNSINYRRSHATNKRPVFPNANDPYASLRTGLNTIINLNNNNPTVNSTHNITHNNNNTQTPLWSGSYTNNISNNSNNASNNGNNGNSPNNLAIKWDLRSGNSIHSHRVETSQQKTANIAEETPTESDAVETNENREAAKKLLGGHRFTQFFDPKIEAPQQPNPSSIENLDPPSDELDHDDSQSEKPKRHRTSPEQLSLLEYVFHTEQMPSQALRQQIAERLGMTSRRVQIWFQNKRAKVKRREAVPVPTLFEDPKHLPLSLHQQHQQHQQHHHELQPQHHPSLTPHIRESQPSGLHDSDPFFFSHPHSHSHPRNMFDPSKVSSPPMNIDRRDIMSLSSLTQQSAESQPPYSRHTSPTRVSILGMKRKEPENLQPLPVPFTTSLTLPRIDAPDLKKRGIFGQIPQPPQPLSLSDRSNRPTLPPLNVSESDEAPPTMLPFPSVHSFSHPHESKRPSFTPLLSPRSSFSKINHAPPSSPMSPQPVHTLATPNSSPSIHHPSHQHHNYPNLHYPTQQSIHHSHNWSYPKI